MESGAGVEVFDTQLDAWRAWQQTPWGRIRYRVVGETLRRTCSSLGTAPLRVLDVGGGDGGDAVPLAEAGHQVTILDYSVPLLDEARVSARERGVAERLTTVHGDLADPATPDLGTFDLVLCHNVVQYQPNSADVIRLLATRVRAGGALSVISVNPPSDVLTAAVRRADLDEVEHLLTAQLARTQTFGHDVRRVFPAEVEAALVDSGFRVVNRYGIRVLTDYITDDARKQEPDFFRRLERLELALCDQEPYLRTARLWQLVAARSELPPTSAQGESG
jgi:S-adenosylmethionine-dependent methyltransferase